MQAPLPCLNKQFSIVAHIVRDTFGQANIQESDIENNLVSLNQYFEPICASFEICEYNYIDNFQYDAINTDQNDWQEMRTKFNRTRRINIFFVEEIADEPYCGFASLGGIAAVENVGIVIVKECVGQDAATITHEMGHFFGLFHTFEGADGPNPEAVDGSNCETAGDLVCDTPADPFIEDDPVGDYVNGDCRFVSPKIDPVTGEYYVADVGNIMSYYPCRCGFTYGQYVRMANTYLNANPKMW